uniref:Mitochondrial ribosomal protein L2 n=1 Tax=Neogobius melanostomus TaxID=47308 RepID=A0A8C6TET5_9GOBI
MAVSCLTRALRFLTVSQPVLLSSQGVAQTKVGGQLVNLGPCRGFLTTATLDQNQRTWKNREKYTIRPIGMRKTGGRDHTATSIRSEPRGETV